MKELLIKLNLPLIPLDRANHFIYGFALFLLLNIFLQDIYCLIIVSAIAIVKEIRDEIVYKGFDIVDIVFTIIPALSIFICNKL